MAELPLDHLTRLTDSRGIFEHAIGTRPNKSHGYCVDDAARALVYTVRECADITGANDGTADGTARGKTDPKVVSQLKALTDTYLTFVASAIRGDGSAHNRMSPRGSWTDVPAGGDWWGRAVYGLGVAAAHAHGSAARVRALHAFKRAARWKTADLRAQMYASIGAAEAVAAYSTTMAARYIAAQATSIVPRVRTPDWPWPEARLRYANGAIPEALIAGGTATGNALAVEHGVYLLDFLLEVETADGRLSVTGCNGRDPGHASPQFDQQPIEVESLASACARAFAVTGEARWRDAVGLAWDWFLGHNDSSTPMVNTSTGAGFDGLTPTGPNTNCGAESTLAALTTRQHARRIGIARTAP